MKQRCRRSTLVPMTLAPTAGRSSRAFMLDLFHGLAFAVAWFAILFEALFPLGVLIGEQRVGATLMVFDALPRWRFMS